MENKKYLHAYLLLGNKQQAIDFAEEILEPGAIRLSNHPDFSMIDTAENTIKIDTIRKLQEKVYEKPITSKRKVYLINESEKLTKDAQNCLLKTLEEPPEYVTIILVAKLEHMLLNTIRSRCTKIVFQEERTDWSEELTKLSQTAVDAFSHIENKDFLKFLAETQFVYKLDNIIEFLEYLNTLFLNDVRAGEYQYMGCFSIVETAKKNLKSNGNFNMMMDSMLLQIWEEVNEKYSWC